AIHAVATGMGYAWTPEDSVRGELERGALKPLPLREGAEKAGTLYLVFADREAAGPGALRLADIIRAAVARDCAER
ncbi:MAG: substrate-binding domain-containing protein, partial [Betaproteobacteria bacterium]|nr:substrate-binding domain-containing protein [Betaproteobacteria bacterium]